MRMFGVCLGTELLTISTMMVTVKHLLLYVPVVLKR